MDGQIQYIFYKDKNRKSNVLSCKMVPVTLSVFEDSQSEQNEASLLINLEHRFPSL